MSKKHLNVEFEIKETEFPDMGIGYLEDGTAVYVKNTIPGQRVICDVKKRRRKHEGYLKEISQRADYEINPECDVFGICGGCNYQNIAYERELEFKKNNVLKLLEKGGIDGFEFCGILSGEKNKCYRNKMEFSFGDECLGGSLALGMRKRNSYYEVANADNCLIANEDMGKILKSVREFFVASGEEFYHKARHTGSLRHLLIRRGEKTGEILVGIVTTNELKTDLMPLVDTILNLKLEGNICGILHIVNDGLADVVKADEIRLLYGRDFYYDTLLGLSFKVSLFSFFQTNTLGAEVLYGVVRDYAKNTDSKVIFDLYCGTGTITQLMSENAQKVVGIEIVDEAVKAARINAELNGITNCEFISGDVLEMVDNLSDKPDLIILDPPREGIHPKAIEKIIAFNAPYLIYISCKASSLAKDLIVFKENNYNIEKITCVDMFPRTYHVETVVLLSRQEDGCCN